MANDPRIEAALRAGEFQFQWKNRDRIYQATDKGDHWRVTWPGQTSGASYPAHEIRDCLYRGDFLLTVMPSVPSIPTAITEYHDACADFEAAQIAVEKAKARIEDARLALKEALG